MTSDRDQMDDVMHDVVDHPSISTRHEHIAVTPRACLQRDMAGCYHNHGSRSDPGMDADLASLFKNVTAGNHNHVDADAFGGCSRAGRPDTDPVGETTRKGLRDVAVIRPDDEDFAKHDTAFRPEG